MRRLTTTRIWAPALSVLALACPASALAAHTSAAGSQSTESAAAAGDQVLASGSGYSGPHGSASVRKLQRRLALAGYAPGPIDGRYGPLTRQAVIAFQAARGLRVDGVVGPQTRAALSRSSVVLLPGAGDLPGGSEPVRGLQRRLATAGYAPGPIDGRYGLLTEKAVRRFQSAHGLRVDGIAGPRTLARVREMPTSVRRSPSPASAPSTAHRRHRSAGSQPAGAQPALSGRYGAQPRVARPNGARPTVAGPKVTRPNVASPNVARPNRPRGGFPMAVLIFGTLAVALILAISLYTRQRSRDRLARPHPAKVAPAEQNGHDAARNVHDHARDRRDGVQSGRDKALSNSRDPAREGPDSAQERRDGEPAGRDAVSVDHGIPATNGNGNGDGNGASHVFGPPYDHSPSAAAEAAYRRADQNGDAAAAFNLGILLEDRGAITEAEAAYRRADNRGHGAAASNLGVLLEERGAVAEAEAAYRRADRHGDATGAFNLGVFLEERGATDEAEAAYRRADERGRGEVADSARAALLDLRKEIPKSPAGSAARGEQHV